MRLHSYIRSHRRPGEQGYILLLLLLIVAMMGITVAVILPTITFEIKRDREEEMIHRGVQYSRAIKAYYKKFGRYPAKIEDLENTNQIRFLRKRYKDPLTGKDFKLLHYGEAKLSMSGISGGAIAGATPVSNISTSGGLGQTSSFGASSFGQSSSFGGNSGFGNSSNSLFGQNSQSSGSSATGSNPSQTPGSPTDTSNTTGTNPSATSNPGDSTSATNTQFGGAPIVGVASTSKEPTIREYDHKKKYNEWQFVYDPTLDQGRLITTPYQPQLQMAGALGGNNGLNGQNGQNGQNGNSSGFGNSGSSFGSSFGNSFGNSQNNSASPGGFNNSNQPQSPPQQQQ